MPLFTAEESITPFNRPLVYSGDMIKEAAQKTLAKFREREKLTEEEQKQQTFLHRIVTVIINHKLYSLSVDEAAFVGLID